nr:hypothetical protein [Novosphingobium flavum]
MPLDLSLLLPDGQQAVAVTLNGRNGVPGEAQRNIKALPRAVDVLLDEGVGAIFLMGIPVAARRGYAEDCSALTALTADRGGVPIVSALNAITLALRALGAQRPLFVTQYGDALNRQVVDYCSDAGVEVLSAVGLNAGNAAEVNALTEADFERLARDAVACNPTADAVVISARPSLLSLGRRLEAELGIPVIEQTAAGVWWALSELGLPLPETADRLFAAAGHHLENMGEE